MPSRVKRPRYTTKQAWLFFAVIIAAAVIVGVIIHIKSVSAFATPQKALSAAGKDTGNIKGVFTYREVAAVVSDKPGENAVVYVCRYKSGKWNYETSKTVDANSNVPLPFLLGTDDAGTDALCVVFADSTNAAAMRLTASDATVKQPISSGTTGSRKFFAFSFDGAKKDTKTYSVAEYDKDNQPLASSDFLFSGGSFDVTCNGTAYHYPVSTTPDIAAAFLARLGGSGLDFSAFSTKPNTADNFILTYTSVVHTMINPAKIKSGAVVYDKVTVQMPLDGSDNNLVFVSGSAHALIAQHPVDTLRSIVMKHISGKQ